jgi:hypothetical protein
MARHRAAWILGIAAILLLVFAVLGMRVAVRMLENRVQQALGPESTIGAIRLGFTRLEVDDLTIRGGSGWPGPLALKADRVIIRPSLLSLFSGPLRVRSITVERPYLSVFKTPGGKVLVVPSLVNKSSQRPPEEKRPAGPSVIIGRITLEGGIVEFYDASVSRPPAMTRMEGIEAEITDLALPTLEARSGFRLKGALAGAHKGGNIELEGWAQLKTLDSNIELRLGDVALAGLEPYLKRSTDVKVKGGRLDLTIRSEVRNARIKAPGTLVIRDLELGRSGGLMGTFMGVPRDAVVGLLKDSGNKIRLDFVIEGDLKNPRFTLREAISDRLASAMAGKIRGGVQGLAEGVGSLGEQGIRKAGGVVKDVKESASRFFGGK